MTDYYFDIIHERVLCLEEIIPLSSTSHCSRLVVILFLFLPGLERQQPRVVLSGAVLARPHVADLLAAVLQLVAELAGVGAAAGQPAALLRLQRLELLFGRVVRGGVRHPEEEVGDGDEVDAGQVPAPTDELFESLDLIFGQEPVCVQGQRVGRLGRLKGTAKIYPNFFDWLLTAHTVW